MRAQPRIHTHSLLKEWTWEIIIIVHLTMIHNEQIILISGFRVEWQTKCWSKCTVILSKPSVKVNTKQEVFPYIGHYLPRIFAHAKQNLHPVYICMFAYMFIYSSIILKTNRYSIFYITIISRIFSFSHV